MSETEVLQMAVMQERARRGHATWTKRRHNARKAASAQRGEEWIRAYTKGYPWYNYESRNMIRCPKDILTCAEISQVHIFFLIDTRHPNHKKVRHGILQIQILTFGITMGYPQDIFF